MKKLLEVNSVCKNFSNPDGGSVSVLENTTFSAQEHEIVAIMGPSGCGKTTLLNIIAGLLKFDSGRVILDQKELTLMNESEKNRFRNKFIGFIFQGSQLIPSLNLVDNVLLPVWFSHKPGNIENDRKRAIELLKNIGLSDRINYLPHQLSQGQRRRVAIARALINDPVLIIADEPTADLDHQRVDQVISILKDLSTEGRALVIATHDEKVARAADRCLVLDDGLLHMEERFKNV
jgi:ABC-type lipoprotein export system ATPase subunit